VPGFCRVEDLRSQLLIVARKAKRAHCVARRAQYLYSSLGELSAVALGERTVAWATLARLPEGCDGAHPLVQDAITALARGLRRSTYSTDRTVRRKLAANLLRVLCWSLRGQWRLDASDVRPGNDEELREHCDRVMSNATFEARRACARAALSDLVRMNAQRSARSVMQDIATKLDVVRFPVFLFE
jgi:hypothetical protein